MDQIAHIRRQVKAFEGKEVTIVADKGRKRKQHYRGTLLGAYSNVFTILCKLSGVQQHLTYSYNDIITGSVVFLRNGKKGDVC